MLMLLYLVLYQIITDVQGGIMVKLYINKE